MTAEEYYHIIIILNLIPNFAALDYRINRIHRPAELSTLTLPKDGFLLTASCIEPIYERSSSKIVFKIPFFFFLLARIPTAYAHKCEVGQERDVYHVWHWVLPYDDPCQCTSIVRGGANMITPKRYFEPVYVDKPLFTSDVNEIRKHYDLECLSKN